MPPLNRDNDYFWLLHTEPKPTVEKKKKLVRFAPQSLQYSTLGRSEFTRQEVAACWYTRNHYLFFTGDIKNTIRMLEYQDPSRQIDDIEYTARGSICRTEETSRRRKQIRHGARDLVLRAQMHPNSSDEWIAMMYTQYSRASTQEAHAQALADHHAAHQIHSESIRHFWDNFFTDDWIRSDSNSPTNGERQAPETFVATSSFDESWLCGAVTTV